MLVGVEDRHPAVPVNFEACGLPELARPVALGADGAEQLALLVELLELVISRVGNEDVPAAVHGNAPGPVEALGPFAPDAEHRQLAAGGVEYAHCVAPGIEDVCTVLKVHRHVHRLFHLVLLRFYGKLAEINAVIGEYLNTAVPAVRDKEHAARYSDPRRVAELLGT